MQVIHPGGAPTPAPAHPLTGVTACTMKRRISRREQYFELRPLGADGAEGGVVLYASQRQVSLPEEYRFSADRRHTRRWFTVRARTRMNLGNAVFEAFDPHDVPLGWFQYQWLESQLLHTWRLVAPGVDVLGQQRSAGVGVARRILSDVPFATLFPVPYAFDVQFRDAMDRVVLRIERRAELRDRYVVTVPEGRVDGRMAAAMALLLDWRGQA